MESPTQSVEVYQRYVAERLCWIDGFPTHASSDLQRQCPHCRKKWSYERLGQELRLLEQYCLGSNASEAARAIECAKNTALYHFGLFSSEMQEAVASMLLDGSIATNPLTVTELRSLENALRAGDRLRREKACRHLFFVSLAYEERLECLFRCHVAKAVETKIEESTREPDIVGPIFQSRADTYDGPSYEARSSLWQRLRGRYDPQSPYPSEACKELGANWVKVWSLLRTVHLGR